jgi:hypothetical protein
MNITEEQLFFLKENNIPLSKVFDATNQKRETYRKSMKALEKLIAINATPCAKYGHTIRTRNGHCCQCNTANIAYIKRHYANGYVYIVGSQEKKVLKVGSTNNIENRVNTLNFENYASINDWKLILYYKCNDMGLIEAEAHNKLQKFQVEKTYIKNGRAQTAYEIFDCNYDVCKIALVNATKDNIIEKYEDELLSKKYYFNNTKKISKVETNIKLINKVANKVNLIKINTINAQKKESPIPKITKETINKKEISILKITKETIEKKEIIKENLSQNTYFNKKKSINLHKKEKNNSVKNISGLFVFISFLVCLVCFFIFLGKFPLNIFFLVSAIFFGYLVSHIN